MDSDGSVHPATRSGVISVPDEYSSELRSSNAVRNGILSTGRSFSLGTRRGMRCNSCKRTWQAWTRICPRCDKETIPE